ncbi:MAG: hypothetical protein FWF88_09975 [Peptococcaceae bacterium]|nr:hypothetical protein [Peptococcaceae bacterium]
MSNQPIPPNLNEETTHAIISDGELFDALQALEEHFQQFLSFSKYAPDLTYFVSRYDLIDVIIQVHKREAYDRFFHRMEMSERKRVALYAFWILKFKPFKITDVRFLDDDSENVNETFAIYLICAILFYANKLQKTAVEKSGFYQNMLYAFRYRSFSVDSMILFVEAISTDTFEREYNGIV